MPPTYNRALLTGEALFRRFSFGSGDENPPEEVLFGGGPMKVAEAGSTWASGFQNTMAISDPAYGHTPGIIIIGGDTAGTSVSFDGGDTWMALNKGRTNIWHSKISGLEFDKNTPNRVIAYASNQNTDADSGNFNSGIFWCDLDPVNKTGIWTEKFNNTDAPSLGVTRVGGDNHPRQTGRMVASDPYTAGRAYVATNKGVVVVIPNNTFSSIRPNDWMTSVCIGPESTASNTVIYATATDPPAGSTPNPGVTKATFVGFGQTGGVVSTVGGAGAPTQPREVVAVTEGSTTVLYVADGANGVKRYNGSSWSTIQPAVTGIIYKTVDARRVGTRTVVIAGHSGGNTSSGEKLIISDDNGSTWTLLSSSQTTDVVAGTTVKLWLYQFKKYFKLGATAGENGYDAARVLIRPDDPNTFFTCGRSGVWRRKIDTGSRLWMPTVQGFGASVALDVAINPVNPKRIACGDVDWSVLTADEYFTQQPHYHEPDNENAHGVAWDPNGTGLVAGMGARDKVGSIAVGGEVFYNADPPPWGTGLWENTGLRARIGANDFRSLGTIVLRDSGTRVLLSVNGSQTANHGGVWQKRGTGTWTRVADAAQGMPHAGSIRIHIRADAAGYIYLFDPLSGVWRSTSYGDPGTWTNIFPINSNTGNRWANDIAISPASGSLFLTTATEMWRIENPRSGTLTAAGVTVSGNISAKKISSGTGPLPTVGPVDVDDSGRIYVATYASSKGACGLYTSTSEGDTWKNVANNRWQQLALFPVSLKVSKDGTRAYAALDGYGYVRATFGN